MIPGRVRIVEVGPRDGLQNEAGTVPLDAKVALIEALADAGLTSIEAGSFVCPRWVPQMADTAAVMARIRRRPGVSYPVLVPNLPGLDAARAAGATEVAVFGAASESSSRRNINCSIAESLARVARPARAGRGDARAGLRVLRAGLPLRGRRCAGGGGRRRPGAACHGLLRGVARRHDRRRHAVAGPAAGGARGADRAGGPAGAALPRHLRAGPGEHPGLPGDGHVGGGQRGGRAGRLPLRPSASGNVATEDVAYMLRGMGVETGLDLPGLCAAGRAISRVLGRPGNSSVAQAQAAPG